MKKLKEDTKRAFKATNENFEQEATEEVTMDEFTEDDFLIEEVAKNKFTDDDFLIEEVANDDIKTWYYIDKGEIIGAFTRNEMLAMYHSGTLKETTEVWNNTMSDWMELGQTTLYEKRRPTQRRMVTQKRKKNKIRKSLIWSGGALCALVIILCIGFYLINIKSKTEPDHMTVTDPATAMQETNDEKGITVKKIVEKYITDPKYDLQTQENKESLLTVTGTLNYEGKAQEAVLQFRIESDGSVHFQQLSINGEIQKDTVYQELIDGMQVE